MRRLVVLALGALGVMASAGCSKSDGGDDSSAACNAFEATMSVDDACAILGGCPTDLKSYLGDGHVSPDSYARVGCGLTEIISNVDVGGDLYTFDSLGRLVGFDRVTDDSSGPCNQRHYFRGQALAGNCPEAKDCRIPENAPFTGMVCACSCPDPPPADGKFYDQDGFCVIPAHPAVDCEPDIQTELDTFGDVGLLVHSGCGAVVAEIPGLLSCSYGPDGVFNGASRSDTAARTCEGVTSWQSGVAYQTCSAEVTCATGSRASSGGVAPCGDAPPDPGKDPACANWQESSDVLASCNTIQSCAPNVASFLTAIQAVSDDYLVREGCGFVEIATRAAEPRQAFVFARDTGVLQGYDIRYETPGGPCAGDMTLEYRRGANLDDCAYVQPCFVNPQGASTGEACACPCPNPPPADGVVAASLDCIYGPFDTHFCEGTLDAAIGAAAANGGYRLRTGCGPTVVDEREHQCVYDVNGMLIAIFDDVTGALQCEGVHVWSLGASYQACAEETSCWIGAAGPEQTPLCP